ncbi:MAG TPA: hypothetical protein VGF38_01185 [Ktedonobacterales bacterium]|jgi:hypothetical protein
MSPYQRIRSEYLVAEYYRELDAQLDARGVPDHDRLDDPLGQAADHYCQAAEIASAIEDGALVAQLKALESRFCYGSHPTRRLYRRAFEAAKAALDAWIALPRRNLTEDTTFAFTLGDALGVRGQLVAEDGEAVRGLEHAAHMLFELQGRPDADPEQYANDDLFLEWDWSYLYFTMGQHRLAFRKARQTRKKGQDLFTPRNRVRFQWLIACIMLACAEDGQVGDYSRNRLLAAGERAIDDALHWAQVCKDAGAEDRAGYAMVLLAEAKWMGLSRKRAGRTAKIEEAEAIAVARGDILLLGQVEIAWGDELSFQYSFRPSKRKFDAAVAHYQRAEEMLSEVEALSLARLAHGRLERLVNPPTPLQPPPGNSGRVSQTSKMPKGPPPDDKMQYN